MNYEKCQCSVMSGYWSHVCGKTARFEVDGKHYCGTHNPNKAPTKAQIEAKTNLELQRKKWQLEKAAPDMLNELSEILEWARTEKSPLRPQEMQSIQAVINKATGVAP